MRKIIIREVDKTKLHYMVAACERYLMSLAGINVSATKSCESVTSLATHIFCSYTISKIYHRGNTKFTCLLAYM